MALNENKKDKRSKMYLAIMIILLILINIGLIYKLINKDNKLDIATTELADTSAELDELKVVEEELRLQLEDKIGQNARLDSIISVRDAEIKMQVNKLRAQLNAGNLSKKQFTNQIASLRDQITSLTNEIEELSKQNQFLKDENYVIQKQVEAEKAKVEEMTEINSDLTKQVEKGSQIMLGALKVSPMKDAVFGDFKVTDKLNKVDKIEIGYALANNNIAEAGEKTLYFQLVSPTKSTIHSSDAGSGKFSYEGGDRLYTVKRVVNFQNKNEYGTFSIPKSEGMTAGQYTLNVYMDTHKMGSTTFTLR